MNPFEFATANRVIFGCGKISELGELAHNLGQHALVLLGLRPELIEILDLLQKDEIQFETWRVHGEPTVEGITQCVQFAREQHIDSVIAIGGGSALDSGKAVAALMNNPGEVMDYLEVIGKGKSLVRPPLPCIAVPTTAGTGSEVTRNVVLRSEEHHLKVSMRSPFLLPAVALVDPGLTIHLPAALTASTGMDALTQLIEPFLSIRANPITDAICRTGLNHARNSLTKVFSNPQDLAAREEMALASLLGGMALANSGLGVVHAIAGVLGGMYRVPHGSLCARLLPAAVRENMNALLKRSPGSPPLQRMSDLGNIFTNLPCAQAADAITWLEDTVDTLQILRLKDLEIPSTGFSDIVSATQKSSSMKANPLPLLDFEILNILEKSF